MNVPAAAADPREQHWLSFQISNQLYAAPLSKVSSPWRITSLTLIIGAA